VFGAFADIFDYGTSPTVWPDYRHKFTVEATYSTAGQAFALLNYDSKTLIPGVRLTSSFTYQFDPLYNFYGLNGDVNEYHDELDRRDGYAWHSYKRHMVRFLNTFQGKIVSKLSWLGGLNYYYYKNGELTLDKYSESPTLYDFYVANGLITDTDRQGNVMEIVAGLSWDSRDWAPAPKKGIFAEIMLNGSPDIFGTGYNYLKLTAKLRQFITPGPDWFVIAYQLAYQGCIAGQQPFYMLQAMYGSQILQQYNEGFGGVGSLRGVMQGKLLGNGYAWGNLELRFRLAEWKTGYDTIRLGINPFFDAGAIVQPYRLEETANAYGMNPEDARTLATRGHYCAGLGIKLGINHDFIASLEWGKSFRKEDGPSMVSLTLNYIF